MTFHTWLLLCLLLPGTRTEEDDCRTFTRLAHHKPGNLTLTGIFDVNAGENCTEAVDFGVEEMAAAVWTVTALERQDYLPGVKIGLSLWDACGSGKAAQEAFAEAVIRESCQGAASAGIIASPEVESRLASISRKLWKTVTRLEHMLDQDGLLTMVAELLTNLHWTTVNRVVADTREVLDAFALKMSDEGICVYDAVLSADEYAVNNEVLTPVDVPHEEIVSRDTPVIVVLCRSERIAAIFEGLSKEMRVLAVRWLLVPTDFVLNVPADNLPAKVFSILPLVDKKDRLLQFLSDEEMQKDHMNHREATRSPLFVKTAAGILQLLKPFKTIQETFCRGKTPCPELERFIADVRGEEATLEPIKSVRVTPESITNSLNLLKIDVSDSEAFLYIAAQAGEGRTTTEDAAIFQVFDGKTRKIRPVPLLVNERLFNERRVRTRRTKRVFRLSVDDIERIRKKEEEEEVRFEATPGDDNDRHPCVDILGQEESNLTRSCGICQNFLRYHVRSTRSSAEESDGGEDAQTGTTWSWRFRTWVAINASVASIGVVCTAAVAAFILHRICKGDILEGSPHFSFLILLSVLLLYACTLPFSLDWPSVCRFRVIPPTLAYPVLFSIILSRSAMLIVSERDGGVMNHVSGFLQSLLCFFMCAVQVALTAQLSLYHPLGESDCAAIHANHHFVLLLSYSFLLLALLAVAAPFTLRSKRNYREGTFFAIATLLVVIVWSAWVSAYYLLPAEEREAAVALGLTATATAVLLSVFIPRTYLMATATVRDKIANTLPSLAYLNASNISEINYRSNQALYDSVTVRYGAPKLSFTNPRIYSVHVANSAPASPNNFPANGSDCVLNRRKTFIEVPGGDSPPNSCGSRESPDRTGKITRF